ncbi:MAG: hypothetical protein NTX25_03280 [Proteobacteria bacterium]|nr:hypothetical protein [Pseudomonadota bacterium]
MYQFSSKVCLLQICLGISGLTLLTQSCSNKTESSQTQGSTEELPQDLSLTGWPYTGFPLPPADVLPKVLAEFTKSALPVAVPGQCQQFGTNGSGPYYTGTEPMKPTTQGMPLDFRSYVREQRFGYMHDKWHAEHTWDNRVILPNSLVRWNCNGFKRWKRQMGDSGSGLDFLAMHRLMVQDARAKFPKYANTYLAGWVKVPTDPYDKANPLPGNATTAFNSEVLVKLNRVQNNLASFKSEDELGQFLWNDLSKVPAPSEFTALHFYLHLRWTDTSDTQTDLSREIQNLENQYFWKLHGWIDRTWANYRTLKGLSDSDPAYVSLLQSAHDEMPHH